MLRSLYLGLVALAGLAGWAGAALAADRPAPPAGDAKAPKCCLLNLFKKKKTVVYESYCPPPPPPCYYAPPPPPVYAPSHGYAPAPLYAPGHSYSPAPLYAPGHTFNPAPLYNSTPLPLQPAPQPALPPAVPIPALPTVPSFTPTTLRNGVQVLSVADFAANFLPVPGPHQVVLVHPVTGSPIEVRFTLPNGTPRKVQAGRRDLEFDYGSRGVEINFEKDGTVTVNYDN
jgi:hypothetical protein